MDPDHVAVQRSVHRDVAVLAVVGDLDLFGAAILDGAVSVAIADGRAVVLDLSGIGFLDSSGLASLSRARRDIRAAGLGFAAAGAPADTAIRHLNSGHVGTLLGARSTRAEAVACVAPLPDRAAACQPPHGSTADRLPRSSPG